MRLQGIHGVSTPAQLAEHVAARGCYDAAENRRIHDKWFTGARPRDHLYAYLDAKLGITSGLICDVGCGYGPTLVHAPPGSYGLELEEYQAAFARSIGLSVHTRNVITDDTSDFPRVDTVWCAATLEHVDAPHVFLRHLYYLLKPGGRLIIEVPCALPARWMRAIPGANYLFGDHDDHINSFSPTTLSRFCERAGFAEDWVFRYSTPLIRRGMPVWATRLPPLAAIGESLVYVGRQIPNWDYPAKATRRAANNEAGYLFRSMFASDDDAGEARRH